jgi:hypothetical protein
MANQFIKRLKNQKYHGFCITFSKYSDGNIYADVVKVRPAIVATGKTKPEAYIKIKKQLKNKRR